VKDQELNPRPHTPRPAALPVKVGQWVECVQKLGERRNTGESLSHDLGISCLFNQLGSDIFTVCMRAFRSVQRGRGAQWPRLYATSTHRDKRAQSVKRVSQELYKWQCRNPNLFAPGLRSSAFCRATSSPQAESPQNMAQGKHKHTPLR